MGKLLEKYRDFLAYIFFGVATTAINIFVFGICSRCGWTTAMANTTAWIVAVLFAYITNRRWVFGSQNHTMSSVFIEFVTFLACRLGTGIIDQVVMIVGVDVVGANYIHPDFLFFWSMAVKVGSNALVIIMNYVFSKLLIFTKKGGNAEK